MTLLELADWVEECLALLPDLRTGAAAAEEIGAAVASLRALVDLHLLREHIADLTAAQEAARQAAASRQHEGSVGS